jgi:Flp pilus assembly protein TadD
VAQSLNTLASLYYDQGKYEQAETLLQRALLIREQVLGTNHPATEATRNDYAFLRRAMGHDAEAKKLEKDF